MEIRTEVEIEEFYAEWKKLDHFKFIGNVVLPYLSRERIEPHMERWWNGDGYSPCDIPSPESCVAHMRDFVLPEGIVAAEAHLGLSSARAVQKLIAWTWLAGDDDAYLFAADKDHFPQFGVPVFQALMKKYGLGFPDKDPKLRRMARGLPCVVSCGSCAITLTDVLR